MISKNEFKIKLIAVIYTLINIYSGCYANTGNGEVSDTKKAPVKASEKMLSSEEHSRVQEQDQDKGAAGCDVAEPESNQAEDLSGERRLGKVGLKRSRTCHSLSLIDDDSEEMSQEISKDETELGSDTEYDDTLPIDDFYENLKNRLIKMNKILAANPGCQRLFGTYAIVGDIHGDFSVFHGVMNALQEDLEANRIDGVVFLGDFWDRQDGDTVIFEELIDFMARNNTDLSYKVVVLRGNHEMQIYRNLPGGNYSKYRNGLPSNLRALMDEFYRLLPFNAIINNNTYLVHGGLPYYPKIDVRGSASKLISCNALMYPQDGTVFADESGILLYSSLWSDFDPDVKTKPLTNSARGCDNFEACCFGSSTIMQYAKIFHDCDPSLNITNYVFGHDHAKGPFSTITFSERGRGCVHVSTVITAPYLTGVDFFGRSNGGAVALVSPTFDITKKYLEISSAEFGSFKIERLLEF